MASSGQQFPGMESSGQQFPASSFPQVPDIRHMESSGQQFPASSFPQVPDIRHSSAKKCKRCEVPNVGKSQDPNVW